MGGGGTTTQYSESPATQALNAKNLELLQAQEAYNLETRPFIEKGYGYTRDENGVLREMTDAERYSAMSPVEKSSYDIGQMAAERQKQAYLGQLPLDEATKQAKFDEFNAVKEGLSRTGNKITGTSFEDAIANSTAGAQNIQNRLKYWKAREDALARGEIDTGANNMINLFNAQNQYGLSNVAGTSNMGQYGQGLLSNYNQTGQLFNQQDAARNQMAMFNAQQRAQSQAGMGKFAGTLLGAGTGFALSGGNPMGAFYGASVGSRI